MLPLIHAQFQRFPPLREQRAIWQTVKFGRYHDQITPQALLGVFIMAMARRMSGLREIAAHCWRALGSRNFSSLCPALRRSSSLAYAQALVARLRDQHRPGRDELVVIDGMAVTLPATTRHRCPRLNRQAVGGGVIWAMAIKTARGLKIVARAEDRRRRADTPGIHDRGAVRDDCARLRRDGIAPHRGQHHPA